MPEDEQTRESYHDHQTIDAHVPKQPSATIDSALPITNNAEHIPFGSHEDVTCQLAGVRNSRLDISGATEPWRSAPYPRTTATQAEELSLTLWMCTQSNSDLPQWSPTQVHNHALQLDHGYQSMSVQGTTESNDNNITIVDTTMSTMLRSVATNIHFPNHPWPRAIEDTVQQGQTGIVEFHPPQATTLTSQGTRHQIGLVQEKPSQPALTADPSPENKRKR
jgi:hypothetical protein